MKRRMKTLSWRKDFKLNATLCFTRTHANVRFARGDVKVENVIVTFYEEEDEHTLAEEGSQI